MSCRYSQRYIFYQFANFRGQSFLFWKGSINNDRTNNILNIENASAGTSNVIGIFSPDSVFLFLDVMTQTTRTLGAIVYEKYWLGETDIWIKTNGIRYANQAEADYFPRRRSLYSFKNGDDLSNSQRNKRQIQITYFGK